MAKSESDRCKLEQGHDEIHAAFRGFRGDPLDLELGEGAEVLGVPQNGVLRQVLLLVAAADEGAAEAGERVHAGSGARGEGLTRSREGRR